MKKLIAFTLCIIVAFAIAGCSKAEQDNQSTSEQTTVTESKTTERTTIADKSEVINIAEDEAKKIADKALKAECDANRYNSFDAFEYSGIELKNPDDGIWAYNHGYGNTAESENLTGHSFYVVGYTDTAELIGTAYICIDAYNGNVLFSGYMGD
ncbi:MAG: hypothetical protein K2G73_05060 [Eubacterium sp.]|nr:hypothetical protein [Eubacterium sp.]